MGSTTVRCLVRTLSLLGIGVSLGCAADTTGPAPLQPSEAYSKLVLNHHAVTMALTAPYDTLRLNAIALSAAGTPLVDTGIPTYTVQNGDARITVSPAGLLTAVAPDVQAQIVASRTIGTVTHADTVIINVNDVSPIPVFTALTIHTLPGDSARRAYEGRIALGIYQIVPRALDANGDSIPNVLFRYDSNDGVLAYILQIVHGNVATTPRPESTVVYAEATVYGVTRKDSLVYLIGWPLLSRILAEPVTKVGSVTSQSIFSPHDDTVAVGATVVWQNESLEPLDVVFDNPPATVQGNVDSAEYYTQQGQVTETIVRAETGGNIAAFKRDSVCHLNLFDDTGKCEQGYDQFVHGRRFPVAGTYPYHSALYGTTGVIHVLPEFQGIKKY